jgi:DNA-binding NarL/FixJ family response regulator
MALRSILADRDPLARRAVRDTLRGAGITVVAETGSGQEAVELATHYRPDVVVTEHLLQGMDGIELTRRLHAFDPSIRIVMLTAASADDVPLVVLAAGAVGFISKDEALTALPRALHGVRNGEAAISRRLTLAMIEQYQAATVGRAGLRPIHSGLSDREWQVLDLLATGATTDEVAERLVLSRETVRSHVKRVYRKLGVRSRDAAVSAASRLRTFDGRVPAPQRGVENL